MAQFQADKVEVNGIQVRLASEALQVLDRCLVDKVAQVPRIVEA